MINIAPIRPDFLLKVKQDGLDDQNQPVEHRIAEGGEPCRNTLRRALPGEKIMLASYCPFENTGPYREYGPIFLSEQESDELPILSEILQPSGKNTDYLGNMFVLRAYNHNEEIVDAEIVDLNNANVVLDSFFSNTAINFVLVRFAAYGCYAFRIEREA